MLRRIAAFLFAICVLVARIEAYSVEIKSGMSSCFIVKAVVGVPITGTYEVIVPDPKYITVKVTGPNGFLHFEKKTSDLEAEEKDKEEESEGFFSFDSELEGDYTMCISNGVDEDGDGIPRLVAFNFRAVAHGQQDYQFLGLQSELSDLSEGLELLKDHQSYMNQREDVHKLSLDSINMKVLCWTVLEAVILISMSLWQIMYIRSFFETKRRM
ncbi:emp24/gp25L/p24 family/GOLD-domain-containing protein [Ochromonadaceae sp. CCMP2298]|nr:emp24/gp25L/p24 family/GOLD-domain-containing protein [Ochromonadaceae sp. CCMP2298]|eukprot:CAMPEP_0173209454 /NCGR_PEP_ID=MMETSP1141-20130122/23104_1 /TAXON_ID=483371 /ORGANISM="non described non described, Strain CCMP2298" /LENGTH=212 /DNA_ID=CAMNT_0014136065 /DNA_START=58 /DNA_END=696 /DNA_ORIENTATION=-